MTQPNQPSIQKNQIQPSNENLVPEFSQQNNETRKIIDEMPIRSSLINTLFLFQYIFVIIFIGYIGRTLKFQKLEIRSFISIPYWTMSIFRTWLVVTLTFKKNDANRQRNADEEKEQRRQIEIQEALRKRQTRNQGKIFS